VQLDRKVLAFGQLPSSKGDLYVPASGRKGYAHNLTLHNTNTTAEDVVLNYHDGTSEHEILSETIPAGDSLYLEFPGEGEVVGIGGKLTGNTTTASKVTFKFSGTEEIPDVLQDAVLWEWNGVDASQFGTAGSPTATDPARNGGNMSGSFSVVAPTVEVTDRPMLKYTHTGGGGTGFWVINDMPALPDRYIVEAAIGPRAASLYTNTYLGVHPFYQDPTHNLYMRRWTGSIDIAMVISNNIQGWTTPTALTLTSPSIADSDTPAHIRVYVSCAVDPGASSDPKFACWWGPFGVRSWLPVGDTVFGPWHSSWQGNGTAKNIALSVYELGAAGANVFADLRVLRWT